MNFPITRTAFQSDKDYQEWGQQYFRRHCMNDGYSYLVSCDTGHVSRGDKMNLTPQKISKSNERP